jgi:hypothetical protein
MAAKHPPGWATADTLANELDSLVARHPGAIDIDAARSIIDRLAGEAKRVHDALAEHGLGALPIGDSPFHPALVHELRDAMRDLLVKPFRKPTDG